ncbi:MAG TPA: M20/M25/M40 family metallo-hydrolase [Pyrinomonadaceae bacterium]|jgi:Zn-dependent M28 family amino/carboxypeptidase
MKRLLLALVLTSSCGAALPSRQPPEEAGQKTEAARPAEQPKKIDAARLLEDVRALSADAMEGRGAGTRGGELARAYLLRRFKEAGLAPLWPTFEQTFDLPAKGGKGVNLVGYVKGAKYPERLIVVTAHYDHLGVRDGQVYNGADDNASGVAVLLQLAAHFQRAARPEHSLVFAALDAEELGLLGARALVKKLRDEKRGVALDVNLDMVGHSERGELYAAGTYHTPALRPALERVAAAAPVKLLLGHDRPGQGNDDWTSQSDQFPFHKAGVPFVYFGVEDHGDYHKPSDDFDTLTRDFFVGAAETVLEAVKALDADLGAAVAAPKSKPGT